MAFPTGWTKKVEITIPAAQVGTGGVTDFSVLLTEANLPAGIFTDARSDGGDIRASSDSAGSTQLAVDLIDFDAGGTAQIRVKVPSLSSAAPNTLWIWYGAASETLPAASDTYGQHNAYDSDWAGYWPLEEDPSGGSNSVLDRTVNANHGTPTGVTASGDLVAAQVGNGLEFDGSGDRVECGAAGAAALTDLLDYSVFGWLKPGATGSTARNAVMSKSDDQIATISASFGQENLEFRVKYSTTDAVAQSANFSGTQTNWRHTAGTIADSDKVPKLYVDGAETTYVAQTTGSGTRTSNSSSSFKIGESRFNNNSWLGILDDIQVHGTPRAAAWITTEFNQTSDPASFASAGTPQTVGGGGGAVGHYYRHLMARRRVA